MSEPRLRFYNHDGDGYWQQCRYCDAYVRLRLDGEPTGNTIQHTRPCPVEELEQCETPNVSLTVANDFLGIGQLLDATRNGQELSSRRYSEIRQAIGRYFGDKDLVMFDHDGLIRWIDEQTPRSER